MYYNFWCSPCWDEGIQCLPSILINRVCVMLFFTVDSRNRIKSGPWKHKSILPTALVLMQSIQFLPPVPLHPDKGTFNCTKRGQIQNWSGEIHNLITLCISLAEEVVETKPGVRFRRDEMWIPRLSRAVIITANILEGILNFSSFGTYVGLSTIRLGHDLTWGADYLTSAMVGFVPLPLKHLGSGPCQYTGLIGPLLWSSLASPLFLWLVPQGSFYTILPLPRESSVKENRSHDVG